MPYYVYVIYSPSFDKFYIGQTNNFTTRLIQRNSGFEKFTSPYRPWQLKCIIEKTTRTEAMRLEKKIKNLNRLKLIRFIEKYQ